MNKSDLPAAYQGRGWQPRNESLAQEISRGEYWSSLCSNSEWMSLEAVLLYLPDSDAPQVKDPNLIQHLAPINNERLNNQMAILSHCYQQMGIQVHFISVDTTTQGGNYAPFHNLVYVRDLFFMTPEGAILARMASTVRAGEELYAAKALIKLGIPIVRTIGGTGTFEGADALWVREDLVLVGVGNRTNQEGFEQVRYCLKAQGVNVIHISLPAQVQHLLGLAQIVDKDLVVIRGELASLELKALLLHLGMTTVEVDESEEVVARQAMNFVTVAPRKIVMVGGNPSARQIYERHGIDVVCEPVVDELLKGAGGLGCATGILHRQLLYERVACD